MKGRTKRFAPLIALSIVLPAAPRIALAQVVARLRVALLPAATAPPPSRGILSCPAVSPPPFLPRAIDGEPLSAVAAAPAVATERDETTSARDEKLAAGRERFDGAKPARLPDASPADVELATAGPERVVPLSAALRRSGAGKAALKRAELIVRGRMRARVPNRRAYDGLESGERFDLYDDLLRLLVLRGFLRGEVVYPLIGADMLPARWASVSGLNWANYGRLFKTMVRAAGRPGYAERVSENARIEKVGDIFHPEQVRKMRRPEGSGPRTLLLKFVHGYNHDYMIRHASSNGYYDNVQVKGLLKYKSWLAALARDAVGVGDYVIVLGKDSAARAFFKASRAFQQVDFDTPELKPVPDYDDIIHLDSQSVYLPGEATVYRKVAPPK